MQLSWPAASGWDAIDNLDSKRSGCLSKSKKVKSTCGCQQTNKQTTSVGLSSVVQTKCSRACMENGALNTHVWRVCGEWSNYKPEKISSDRVAAAATQRASPHEVLSPAQVDKWSSEVEGKNLDLIRLKKKAFIYVPGVHMQQHFLEPARACSSTFMSALAGLHIRVLASPRSARRHVMHQDRP